MNCKACNAEYKDRKLPDGTWADMCRPCDKASRLELAEAIPERQERPSTAQMLLWWSKDLHNHDFGEGLGLMAPEDRLQHRRERASEAFWDALNMGQDYESAKEAALGTKRFRGVQRDVTPGLTSLV
jgi:hypothetical protein